MKRLVVLALLSLGLCVPSASPASFKAVKFKPCTFGYVKDGFLAAATPRNRILVGRTRAQALRWDNSIWHRYTTAPQPLDFVTQTALGVFLIDRPTAAVQGVVVTSLAVSGETLFLTLSVSPYPVTLRGPGVDSPIEYFELPGPPSSGYHAFTIVTVAKAAVAHVRRVVVTQEEYDPNDPLVVDVPVLPF